MEYFVLKKLLLKYKPNKVFVAVNTTDITDVIKAGGWERNTTPKRPPWWAYIYQFSFITRAVIHATKKTDWLFLSAEQYKQEEKMALEKIKQCIVHDYYGLSKENNFELVVILHPMLGELENNSFALQPLANQLRRYPKIKTLNLFEAFKQEQTLKGVPYQSLYWQQDGHHNSTGYKLWASVVADSVLAY